MPGRSRPSRSRPSVCLDFDGVIHAYRNGWQGGVIYDELTPGCSDALHELHKVARLSICTARFNLDDVDAYLRERHLLHLFEEVENTKPTAALYVDDRGLRFTGDWAEVLRAARDL